MGSVGSILGPAIHYLGALYKLLSFLGQFLHLFSRIHLYLLHEPVGRI